uniref:Uncharacterized protein n=1 Tax=Schistosoma mansoni TaxID=6183 RepID=A0A5K4F6X9_SCHMA
MVCLVWFHVAALLLLLHTSTQTYVDLNELEDIEAEISYSEEQLGVLSEKINASDSEIQSLRDKIIKADPQGMMNIDEFIKCKSEYWIANRATQALLAIQNLKKYYQAKYPHVKFDFSNLEAPIIEKAERYENLRSEGGLRNCIELIPHETADVIQIDEQIFSKYIDVEYLDMESFIHSFLSQLLEAMSNDGK